LIEGTKPTRLIRFVRLPQSGQKKKQEPQIEKPGGTQEAESKIFKPCVFPNDSRKNWEAWVNLVKSSIGAGLLGMPNAFLQAGLVFGLFSTILIGVFCVYTLQILVSVRSHTMTIGIKPDFGPI